MDCDPLWTIADRARSGKRLTPEEIAYVRDAAPAIFEAFPNLNLPKSIRHPAGFSVSGAPVGTFIRSALLMAGRKTFGPRYEASAFYQDVEKDLAFRIMRSNFHNGYPRGTHCCAQCSLAIYPVLEAGAIRFFDCAELAKNLRSLIDNRQWRFATPPNARMLQWALSGASA